ncbi:hypothetical protein GOBAR_DD01944 [Gossypium barbadense]|nr:hypothetical protein GOBAR_DD01944 [Gossypium barbadense]
MDVSKNFSADINDILRNTKELKEKLKENLRNKSDFLKNGKVRCCSMEKKILQAEILCRQDIEITRKEIVCVLTMKSTLLSMHVQKYTEGLLWVLLYYFLGVPSWACAHALPKLYPKLITDADSQIIDFYPTDFEIDTDGKRHAWQGICKLPFIDEERLLSETLRLEKELTQEETERNAVKSDQLFVPSTLGSKILTLLPDNQKLHTESELIRTCIIVTYHVSRFETMHVEIMDRLDFICFFYMSLPFKIPIGKLHIPRPLEGVEYPEKSITEADIQKTQLWHEYLGTRPPYNRFDTCKVGGAGSSSNTAKAIADMKISEPGHSSIFGYGRGQKWRRSSQQLSSFRSSTSNTNNAWRRGPCKSNNNDSGSGLK